MPQRLRVLKSLAFACCIALLLVRVAESGLGVCKTPYAATSQADGQNGCQCADGWAYAPDCSVCTSDLGCVNVKGNGTCDSSMIAVNYARGFCSVVTPGANSLLQGQGYALFGMEKAGTASAEMIKQDPNTLAWGSIFKCAGRNCSQAEDPKTREIRTTCASASCVTTCVVGGPDVACSSTIADAVKGMGKGFSITCQVADSTCTVHENLLDFLYPGGVALDKCLWGECRDLGVVATIAQSSFAGPPVSTERAEAMHEGTEVEAIFLAALLLLVIVIGVSLHVAFSGYNDYAACQKLVGGLKPPALVRTDTTLAFKNVSYRLKGRQILNNVSGVAPGGEVLAIMGPSGCGKSTFLDILSMKTKSGRASGDICVNGVPAKASFKQDIGFVDQHDMLLPTMTVLESLMFSALLRLPRTDSLQMKTQRVLSVMGELQLAHIADSRIGNEVKRGISGGEKRRVSVGMELVTQPRALFLDEPTSGLDTYNASLLVTILLRLAQNRGTAVVMTIHQPRANIFARFDRLLLMCKGEVVYVGPAAGVHDYFSSIDVPIPKEYNPADYLIDIIFTYGDEPPSAETMPDEASVLLANTSEDSAAPSATSENTRRPSVALSEKSLKVRATHRSIQRSMDVESQASYAFRERPVAPETISRRSTRSSSLGGDATAAAKTLAQRFACSKVFRNTAMEVELQIKRASLQEEVTASGDTSAEPPTRTPFLLHKTSTFHLTDDGEKGNRGAAQRVPWIMEVAVVSQRMFIDMRRKPMLVGVHVGACIYYGLLLGGLFFQLNMSGEPAVQNRLGMFMLEAIFLAFTSVSALPLFWLERPLYIHERSNRYYGSFSYYIAKVLGDLIPLRVIPPIFLSTITYFMVGLRGGVHFWYYTLILILLSVIAAGVNLIIGMCTSSIMSGILMATISMIHFLLLTSIFVHFDTMKLKPLRLLRWVSFFNYGYEALTVNELKGRTLVNFEASLETLLNMLGFHLDKLELNMLVLVNYAVGMIVLAYLVLRFAVKEKR